jgi:hypothetical protein
VRQIGVCNGRHMVGEGEFIMTNQEMVELLDNIWVMDPREEEELLDEGFEEGLEDLLNDEDELIDEED